MSSSENENNSRSPSPSPYKQHVPGIATNADGLRTGLLSNVFSFVSREITEFVINATGVAESSVAQPVAGPSCEHIGPGHQTEKRHRRQSTLSYSRHDSRASKRVRTDLEERSYTAMSSTNNGVNVVAYGVSGPLELLTHPPHSSSTRRPRTTSVTMPGSLFSRSPTPDDSPDARRVRFASGIASPVPRRQRSLNRRASHVANDQQLNEELGQDGDEEGGDEQYGEEDPQSNSDEDSEGRPSFSPSRVDANSHLSSPFSKHSSTIVGISRPVPAGPLCPPTTKSVKDVEVRLDSDHPPRPFTPLTGKGKARQIETESQMSWPVVEEDKIKGPVRLRSDVVSGVLPSIGSVKGAPTVNTVARHGTNEGTSVEHTTGNRSAIDVAVSKRIQELEEKVRSLESELARRPPRRETDAPTPPPPPPPPPPLSSTSRIPLTSSPRRGPGVNRVLASILAGLKTPNVPEASKVVPKNRLPTVPADKMQEFLSELKTVRLRRVGSGNLSQSTANSSSAFEHSQSSSQLSSLTEDRSAIGCKRKRLDNDKESRGALVAAMKRRFTISSQPATVSTSSVASNSSAHLFLPPPRSSTLVQHCSSTAVSIIPPEAYVATPSLCSDNDNEADDRAPSTPPSIPSRPGSTRFIHRLGDRRNDPAPTSVDVQRPREQHREHEICGLPSRGLQKMDSLPPAKEPTRGCSLPSTSTESLTGRALPRPAEVAADPFCRRPPSSPMPPDTPRRPRPPGRVRHGSKPPPRCTSVQSRSISPSGDADVDDTSSITFAPPDASTPAPDPVGKRRPAQGQAARKQRRATLDEEIRRVESSYSDEERAVNTVEVQGHQSGYSDVEQTVNQVTTRRRQSSYSDEERALQDLESGVLLGTGRRSKRLGFLAHGGAGGAPVMMGVGNVEDAVVEDPAVGEQKTKEVKVGRGKRQVRSNVREKRKPKR